MGSSPQSRRETQLTTSRYAAVRDRWWLMLPVLIAVALPLWQMQFRYGWLDMAFGSFAWLFWTLGLIWLVLTVAAIRQHRAWWLLITAPLVLYPVIMSLGLLAACATGNCL